jgi:hypothetical protein
VTHSNAQELALLQRLSRYSAEFPSLCLACSVETDSFDIMKQKREDRKARRAKKAFSLGLSPESRL